LNTLNGIDLSTALSHTGEILEFNLKQNKKEISFKGGLSLKFKKLCTLFIATKYL